MSPLSKLLRAAMTLALVFGPRLVEAQKALVYCPVSIDATGCATIKTALTSAYPGGIDTGFDGSQGTVDLTTVDLFQYSVVVIPSLADDSTAPYALLRDATVASKLKAALLGRRAFWSGTPDQGVVSTTRPQKDALIQNLAAWAGGDFATVNAPGLVVLQDNSTAVTKRYDWVQAIAGFALVADTRLASYSAVSSLTAAGNAVLSSNGSTLAYANMASMGFQTPSGAPGTSMDVVGQTGTGVGGQVVLITQTGANTGGAVVTTDKDDYSPGTTVVITGSGFGAGETVTLLLHEDPTIEPDFSFTATADQNGGFVFSGFSPDTLDVDVRFVLTATGQTSGRRAQTTFTDGNVTTVANTVARNATGASNSTIACAASTPGSFVLNTVYCGQTQVTGISGGGTTDIVLNWTNPSNSVTCSAQINVVLNATYSLNCQLNAAGTWVFSVCKNAACNGSNLFTSLNVVVGATQNQTISFTSSAPANAKYGDTYTPTATASSGLGVVFTTTGACSFSGGVVTMTGVGSCTVNANQSGNGSFNPAPQQQQTFAVAARAVTVTADPQSKVYGAADPALTYQLTSGSLVGSDAFSGALARTAGTAVASYAITQGTLSLGSNYSISFVGASFTITPRAITVTADAKAKGFGDADPTLTYTVTTGSLVGTDAFSGTLTRVAGENIGPYAIQQGSLSAGTNYTLSYTGASLTITTRAVTVTADPLTKGYGAVDPALTYTITTGSLIGSDVFSGSLTRAPGEAVGPYAITQGTLALSSNYALTVTPGTFTITARAITVTAAAKSKVYGDVDPALTYAITTGSLVGTDAFTGALSRVAGENAGPYAITQGTLALNGNYVITYAGANLTITPKAITVTADAKSKIYGAADPALTFSAVAGSLVGSDQLTGTPTRVAGENVGAYAIQQGSVTGGGNYTINFVSADLTITQRALTITADPKTKVYGDADPTLTYQLTSGSLVSGDTFSGSLSRAPGENVGPYAILQGGVTAGNNYAITYAGANLTITTRAIAVTADPQTKIYGDPDPALTYQVTSGSLAFSDAFSGTLTRDPGNPVGTYAINQGSLTAGSNYALTFIGANLTITPRAITVTVDPKTRVYGDPDPTFTYTVTSGALYYGDVLTGTLGRTAGENVGPYAINQGSLNGAPNYIITFAGANLTITARPVTATADAKTKTYGDADPALTYQLTNGSLVFSDAFGGALTRAPGENVGIYAVSQGSLSLSSNYDLTFVGANLTITTRLVTITADAKSKVYGDADPALTYQITSGSLAFTDAFAGSLARAAGENVGPYAIDQGTVALNANYVLSYVGANLTITPRPITATADAKSKIYGDADPALTYQITSGNLVNGDVFAGALTRAAGENVGPYAILQGSLTLSGNYLLAYAGADLTINQRPIGITADAKTKVYGDADPALTYQLTSGNLIGTDAFTGALSRAPGENVGAYAILQGNVTAGGNYALSYTGANLSITPRPITAAADAKSKVYGDVDPSLTYQITVGSLVGTDVFSGAPSTATGSSATVGTHPIVQNTLALSTNYTLTFVGASLTVTPRLITVTADAKTKVYGDPDPALTAQLTSGNLAYTDALSGSLSRVAGENVGPYAIQQNGLTAGTNYTLTYVGANLVITPRPITLKPVAPDLIWSGSPQTPVYSLGISSGTLGNGDLISVFTGAIYSPMSVTNVGTYYPTLLGAAHANYIVAYAGGMFKVLDQAKPTGAITELLPIPLGGAPLLKVNFTDVATGNSNIVEWQYRLDNAPYGASTIPVSPQSSNVNVQTSVVVPTNATDVFKVCVQGRDAGNNWSPETCALLAIYDPSAGFVTGGGWINSPRGAYAPDTTLTGKANFGFVSKYKKGANAPSGNTEFQFQEGNLNFSSTSFQWLVIQGTTGAQFKGTGTINGTGNYTFMVTAIDGDNFGNKKPDSFRIKISGSNGVVYDNQMNVDETSLSATVLGGGSIVIHDK